MKTCSRLLVNSGLDVSTYETTVLEDIFPFLFSISPKNKWIERKYKGRFLGLWIRFWMSCLIVNLKSTFQNLNPHCGCRFWNVGKFPNEHILRKPFFVSSRIAFPPQMCWGQTTQMYQVRVALIKFLFQSEAKCKAVYTKMLFIFPCKYM